MELAPGNQEETGHYMYGVLDFVIVMGYLMQYYSQRRMDVELRFRAKDRRRDTENSVKT
jgi:hypothetical protein